MTAQRAPRHPVLRGLDAVTVTVPDLDAGLRFYRDQLDHELIWRNDDLGQAGLRCPESMTELVLTTELPAEPNWLVESVDVTVEIIVAAGGRLISAPTDIPVGRVGVVADPFGNRLVLVDLSKGRYRTDPNGTVIDVIAESPAAPGDR